MSFIFERQRTDVFVILNSELCFIGVFDDRRQLQLGHLCPCAHSDLRRGLNRLLHGRARLRPQMRVSQSDARRGRGYAVDPELRCKMAAAAKATSATPAPNSPAVSR